MCRRRASSSLQFELHDFDARIADVPEPARDSSLLPIELAASERPAAIGESRNTLAPVDNDTDAGGRLGNRRSRLAWLQHQPPASHPFVVHDLLITGSVRTRRRRKLPGTVSKNK